MSKEFAGELDRISPERLVGRSTVSVEEFFLVLAAIYNDIKDLVQLHVLFRDSYRKPSEGEESNHSGNYSGLDNHFTRLFIGLVNEFIVFIEENHHVTDTTGYADVIKRVPSPQKILWSQIMDIACGRNKPEEYTEFVRTLAAIRGTIGFHYYKAGNGLRKAFIRRFEEREKKFSNEAAYFSLGDSMHKTRFFYADAAVEDYMWSEANRYLGMEQDVHGYVSFHDKLREQVSVLNQVIYHLMRAYIKSRPH